MRPGLVSLILFFIELGLLIIIIVKNQTHPQFRIIAAIMILLQVYQLMEFFLCIGMNEGIVGKLALITITFLPPFGHLLVLRALKKHWFDIYLWFAFGIGFAIYYSVIPNSLMVLDCNPFYATYFFPLGNLYTAYYFGVILWSLILLIFYLFRTKATFLVRRDLYVLTGYIAFLLPMIFTYWLFEESRNSVTSILCKYAILLAVTLFIYSFQNQQDMTEETEMSSLSK